MGLPIASLCRNQYTHLLAGNRYGSRGCYLVVLCLTPACNFHQGLRVLRPRILAFLGRCGAAAEAVARSAALQMPSSGSAAASSTAAEGDAGEGLLQWDLHRRAGLMLSFEDIGRLQFWLDPLLPQVGATMCTHGLVTPA